MLVFDNLLFLPLCGTAYKHFTYGSYRVTMPISLNVSIVLALLASSQYTRRQPLGRTYALILSLNLQYLEVPLLLKYRKLGATYEDSKHKSSVHPLSKQTTAHEVTLLCQT